MTTPALALPAELPPHHRPIPRILAAMAALVIVSVTAFAGATSSAQASEVVPVQEGATLVANDDTYTVVPGWQFTTTSREGLLANDVHSTGAAFSLNSFGQPQGAFSMDNDGAFTWQVPLDFCGETSFIYDVTDGSITSELATVTLRAVSNKGEPMGCEANDPVPTIAAEDDTFFVEPGQSYTRTPSQGLLANDQHSAGSGFEVVSYSEPAVGAFSLLADGSFTWTVPVDFCDELVFTYVAGDGVVSSAVATVTLYANISGKPIECEPAGEQPGEEPIDEPSSPTIPTLPLPTDPGTPGDGPELSDAPATPARDTLAYTGAADELAQGLGWGALLAIMLGIGLTVPPVRRGAGA